MQTPRASRPVLTQGHVLSAIWPLRLVFLGGLLCTMDYVALRGRHWQFDLLNDVLGMVLIAVGVSRLARLPVHPPWSDHYGAAMRWARAVALIGVAEASMGHVVFAHPPLLDIALAGFRIVQLGTMLLFCVSMRWLCARAELPAARRQWDIATGFFVVLWLIPLGVMFYTEFLTLMAGRPAVRDLGAARYALQAVLAVPFVSLYLATSRLTTEAKSKHWQPQPDGPPPSKGA